MNHKFTQEEQKYLESFKTATLDLATFHHKEHILVTYVLLIQTTIDETYNIIKKGILNILTTVGADTTKYHETMTYAWVLIVKQFMDKTSECNNFKEFIQQNQRLLDLNILYQHYSQELIQSEEARLNILEADIEVIDII